MSAKSTLCTNACYHKHYKAKVKLKFVNNAFIDSKQNPKITYMLRILISITNTWYIFTCYYCQLPVVHTLTPYKVFMSMHTECMSSIFLRPFLAEKMLNSQR